MAKLNLTLYAGGDLGRIVYKHPSYGTDMSVTALAVAPQNVVWAMLHQRLVRYERDQWYRVTNLEGLLPNELVVSKMCWWQDRLWVAHTGLWIYHNDDLQWVSALPHKQTVELMVSDTGRLIVGFAQAGLWWSDDGYRWTQLPLLDDLSHLHTFTTDTASDIWVVAQNELHHADKSRGNTRKLAITFNDRGWTTAQMVVLKYSFESGSWQQKAMLPKPTQVMTLLVRSEGDIWIGTEGDGLWHYAQQQWSHIRSRGRNKREQGSLPSNYLVALYSDSDNKLWTIHLHASIVGLFEKDRWFSVGPSPVKDKVGNPVIWSLHSVRTACLDVQQGRLWFGTGGGEIGWINTAAPNPITIPKSAVLEEYLSAQVQCI